MKPIRPKATELLCERCHKVQPTTRPAPDVITASGAFMMLCATCWADTGAKDER